MKKRILSLLLALVLLLGVLPTGVLADGNKLSVTLSGLHSAQVNDLKLYTYTDGVKGEANLLDGLTTVADDSEKKYENVQLDAGTYWVEGYDEKENCNGGLAITVDADHKEFKIQRMYQISVSPSSWVKDTDYTLSLKITDASGTERKTALGTAAPWGTAYTSAIFVLGDTVSATVTPNAEKYPNYNAATASKTPTMNDSLSLTCKEFVEVKITAPAGSTVDAGTLTKYFVFSFLPSVDITEENKTATFKFDKSTDYFFRVRHPEGATYWNYVKLTANAEYTVTEEDLGLSGDFSKSTIYRFDKNVYDRAGIYLNINTKGYKNMAVGDTFELNSFRNWFAIESYMNAQVALPEMHYQVIDANGNASDVVTITPNEKNSNVATMTANKAGTAIVLVTYDAMTDMTGQSSVSAAKDKTADTQRFSAIWPELTGVFVVTVGADGSAIQTNMNLDRMDAEITKDEAKQLDAEHDILFYTEEGGATYSFKPEDGCEVTVLRPTVSATALTYTTGFVSDGVTTAEDGTATITGLQTGRSIVKVTKNGLSTYQVITARKVSYELQDKDGKALTDEAKAALKPGDSVTIQFSNLVSPKEKLSGVYNFNFTPYLKGSDGTHFMGDSGGGKWSVGVYDFSGNATRQKLTITIPKYWTEESYTLTGAIKQGGYAGVPTHRNVTYARGAEKGLDAPSVSGILSRLPEITLPVQKVDFLTGKLVFQDQNGTAIDRKDLTIMLTDAQDNVRPVEADGTFSAYAETYNYVISGETVEYKTDSVTLTEGGENTFTITLTAAATGTWDGKAQTEPSKDDTNVYQISNGAELAWFVNQSKTADVSGKLTTDINLGNYPWLDITSSKKVELDGDSHAITGLNATAGLFTQFSSNSHIQNLTIRGKVSGKEKLGAIAGNITGSNTIIENCVNEASVTATDSKAGGLVGSANGVTIKNCANKAAVSGSSSVGGILGGFAYSGAVITGCYNTGAVTATSTAGGIFGSSSYGVTVEDCYNTGKITGSTSGGIGGEVKGSVSWSGTVSTKMTVSSCYSTGEAAAAAVFGTVHTASVDISKCYYLNTLKEDANAEALSANDLKDADLSDAFKPVCGSGYPALSWQKDVTFHEASGDGTVTAPKCLTKGYTTLACSECGASYRTTYTAALGHDFCEDTEGCTGCVLSKAPTCTETGTRTRTCRHAGCTVTKVDTVPAKGHTPKEGTGETHIGYTTYICAVCGESYQDWTDDLLGHVSYREVGLSDITVSHNGSYPWVYNTETKRLESSNVGVDNSTSESSFTFTLNFPATLRFSYGVSSEYSGDELTITLTPDGGSAQKIANAISGEKTGTYEKQLEAGSYTLKLSYEKDPGAASGSDLGYVKGLGFTPMVHVTVENTLYKKADGAAWEGTLVDTWVTLTGESTIGSCTAAALEGHTVDGIENNYISSIDSLGQMQGSSSAGWMITLNDWFIHQGLNNFGFANGYLDAGDEIRIMYTMDGGPDLGSDWESTDTSLQSLKALGGMLTPKFSGETGTYTLTLPEGTTSVKLTPTAANKNYQVRTYLGSQATGKEYRRTQPIPVQEGSVITVVCGDPSWPTMNANSNTPGDDSAADRDTPDKHTYTLTVQYGVVKSDDTGVSSVKVANVAAAQTEDGNFTVTLPAGTKVSASSFAITTADSNASVNTPTASGNVWSFTVTAEDGTTKTYTVTVTVRDAKTISVTASMQAENTFMLVPKKLSVSSGLAESYGYEDAVTDGVSALDVLVKVHEAIFGEGFTEETKDEYLSVSSSGWVTKVAGETDGFSFAVDGEYPCDRSGEYGQYGYTGYAINQAPVSNNGSVEFFFYQNSSYMDYYTWFTDASGSRLDAITVTAGESFTLGLDGYMYAYAGSLTPEDRVKQGAVLDPEDIQICTANAETGELTPVDGKTVDENGKATLSFAQAGTYILSAIGDEYTDIVSPWLKVTVTRSAAVRVTVTPDTVSAVVSGSTIRLVGFVNEGEDITVNGQVVKNGDTITINGSTYRIDASGVTVKPVTVNVEEATPTAEVSSTASNPEKAQEAADKISSSTQTKSEGLAEAASDKLISEGTKEAEKVTAAEGQKVEVTAKPSLEIEVLDVETTGAQTTLTLDITPKVTYTTTVKDAKTNEVIEDADVPEPVTKKIDNKDINAPITISIPLPEGMSTDNLYIKHIFSDGSGFEYIKPTIKIVGGETIATWQQSSFSVVVLMADARRATVTINGESKTLTPDLVNKDLPVASKDGMIFTGWTFKIGDTDFPGGPYTKLTDELLTALDEARQNGTDVTATPNFKERPSSGSSAKTESPNKPKSEITVDASKFNDVSRSDWFYNAVQYALENGLMNGTSASEFSPNAATTRGMIVTILARGEGVNTNGTPWYGEGQKWAMQNGISDGSNMPGVITREQLATILFRYAKLKGYDTSKSASLKDFPDAGSVSSYAVDAMQWAVAEGLITGMNGKLNPQGSATRAQAATILMRFMQNIAK